MKSRNKTYLAYYDIIINNPVNKTKMAFPNLSSSHRKETEGEDKAIE